jgi:adenylate kinase family enzyme
MEADKATKTLILMRGLPGSGKSTKAKILAGEKGLVFSTDDFFMVGDKYVFDPQMIGEYHERNYERTVVAIKE